MEESLADPVLVYFEEYTCGAAYAGFPSNVIGLLSISTGVLMSLVEVSSCAVDSVLDGIIGSGPYTEVLPRRKWFLRTLS